MAVSKLIYSLSPASEELDRKLGLQVTAIGLSPRMSQEMSDRGIVTVQDLLHCTAQDLLGFLRSETSLEEIYLALESLGFYRANRSPSNVAENRNEAPRSAGQQQLSQVALYIDPGSAGVADVQAVLEALSEYHRAAGGIGLEFDSDEESYLGVKLTLL